jgi:hypothetical protein
MVVQKVVQKEDWYVLLSAVPLELYWGSNWEMMWENEWVE